MNDAFVCADGDLQPGDIRVVSLGRDAMGLPFQALILREEDGTLRAYRNLCRHLPVPLDGGSRRFLTPDKQHVVCGTHGAYYRVRDGYCERGPCAGTHLVAVRVENRNGELYVVRED